MARPVRRPTPDTGAAEPPPAKPAGGGIQSLQRAVAILEAIAGKADGTSLVELSRAVGLHTSTAFHLTQTLVGLGCVRQDEATRRYHVGPRLFALAAGAVGEAGLAHLCRPELERLATDTGENSHLAVWAGSRRDEVVILAKGESPAPVRLNERVGAGRPAYATAIGRVLLAALDPERLEAYLAAHRPLAAYTQKTVTDPERLRAALAEVRRDGVAFDDCEFNADVRCIAAPVRDFTGHTVAAVGISGPVWRVTLAEVGRLADRVGAAARALSDQLGGGAAAQGAGRVVPDTRAGHKP